MLTSNRQIGSLLNLQINLLCPFFFLQHKTQHASTVAFQPVSQYKPTSGLVYSEERGNGDSGRVFEIQNRPEALCFVFFFMSLMLCS